MKPYLTHASILAALLALFGQAVAEGKKGGEGGGQGKAIFLKQKCQQCHTVRSEGIGKAAVAGEDEKGEGGVAPPDLSGAGDERDAKWMASYLMKKTAIDGRKHKKRFKGDSKELGVLTEWLATLKSKKDSAKVGGKASTEGGAPATGPGVGQGRESGKGQGYGEEGESGNAKGYGKGGASGADTRADSTRRKDGGRDESGQGPASGTGGKGGEKK